jgi:hypothetical protein
LHSRQGKRERANKLLKRAQVKKKMRAPSLMPIRWIFSLEDSRNSWKRRKISKVIKKRTWGQEPSELTTIVASLDISSPIVHMREEKRVKTRRRRATRRTRSSSRKSIMIKSILVKSEIQMKKAFTLTMMVWQPWSLRGLYQANLATVVIKGSLSSKLLLPNLNEGKHTYLMAKESKRKVKAPSSPEYVSSDDEVDSEPKLFLCDMGCVMRTS